MDKNHLSNAHIAIRERIGSCDFTYTGSVACLIHGLNIEVNNVDVVTSYAGVYDLVQRSNARSMVHSGNPNLSHMTGSLVRVPLGYTNVEVMAEPVIKAKDGESVVVRELETQMLPLPTTGTMVRVLTLDALIKFYWALGRVSDHTKMTLLTTHRSRAYS